MSRHDLPDAHWTLIAHLFPTKKGRPGRPWNDHRRTLNGIIWILRTGAPWRDLPTEYGPWQSVYDRFNRWCSDGMWDRIHSSLLRLLDDAGAIDYDLWFIDGSCVRASRSAAGAAMQSDPTEPAHHALGRSRGGFGTKLHLVTDSHGIPITVTISPGQRHESRWIEQTMNAIRIPNRRGPARRRPHRLGADKAYSLRWIRSWLRSKKIHAVIPTRKDQPTLTTFDRAAYRTRNVIERCIGWLKEARRVATRHEKLARNYLGMIKLAILHRTLRVLSAGSVPDVS